MRTKGMVQWATGARLQRIRRDDGTYEMEMDALKKRVEKLAKSKPVTAKVVFKEGQLVLVNENLEIAGEVDPKGAWVKIRGHKHGADIIKALPAWFTEAYNKLLLEVVAK